MCVWGGGESKFIRTSEIKVTREGEYVEREREEGRERDTDRQTDRQTEKEKEGVGSEDKLVSLVGERKKLGAGPVLVERGNVMSL